MAGANGDNWVRELDYLRAFAILGVVAIHVGSFSLTLEDPGAVGAVTDFIAHLSDFGIPLFFFISGFVLALRYFDRGTREGFYLRRLSTIVPPYLAFSTAYLAYGYLVLGQTSVYRAAWSYLLFDATGIFWFLAAMVQMYLLFPYLATWMGVLEARGRAWRAPVYAGVLYVAWHAGLDQLVASALNVWQPVPGFGEIVAARLFPGFLLFFVIGMYLARDRPSSRRAVEQLSRPAMVVPLLAGAAVLQLLGTNGFWWWMAIVPYSLVASALLLRLSRWLASRKGPVKDGLEVVGRYSFGIYLAHILVMAIVVNRLWAMGLGAQDALFYILLYALTVGGCIAGLWALNLLPRGTWLTGVKKSKKKGEERKLPRIGRRAL